MIKSSGIVFLSFSLVLLCLFNPVESKLEDKFDDITKYIKEMRNRVEEYKEYFNITKNITNNTDIIENIKTESIDNITSSAMVQRTQGIKDTMLSAFLERFIKRMKLPEAHQSEVSKELKDLATVNSNDWQNYKFFYSVNNSSCNYISIFAQHDVKEKKSNWMYVEISTSFSITEILVITKTQRSLGKLEEVVQVVSKPKEYGDKELDLVMKFYETSAVKAMEKFLGIPDMKFNHNHDSLLFLQ